jgi:hypothetical protein
MSHMPEYSPSEILRRFQGFDSTTYTADLAAGGGGNFAAHGARHAGSMPPPSRPLPHIQEVPTNVHAHVNGGVGPSTTLVPTAGEATAAAAAALSAGTFAGGDVPGPFYRRPQFWIAVIAVLALVGFIGLQLWRRYKAYKARKAQEQEQLRRREVERLRLANGPSPAAVAANEASTSRAAAEAAAARAATADAQEALPAPGGDGPTAADDKEEDENLTLLSELDDEA